MKVKIFDESHEKDLEQAINEWINSKGLEYDDIKDIKYSTSIASAENEQFYCFSAMIIYYPKRGGNI